MRRLPGSHVPNVKNRSSKHLGWLTGYKPAIRSMSNAALEEMAKDQGKMRGSPAAKKELARREAKRAKKAAKGAA